MTLTHGSVIAEVAAQVEEMLMDLRPEDIPVLVGTLERLKVVALARLPVGPNGTVADGTTDRVTDTLLTVEEAAKKLSVTEDWLYRRTKTLPFVVKIENKHVRYSAAGI